MLVIKNIRHGMRKHNDEIKFCQQLLKAVGASDIFINFYDKFPDNVRGKLIESREISLDFLNDIKISDYVNFSKYAISQLIIEFEFLLNIKEVGQEISAYLRLNNDKLRNWIANNSYERLLREHTWTKRWEMVLDDIRKCKLARAKRNHLIIRKGAVANVNFEKA